MTKETLQQQYIQLAITNQQLPTIYRFANWTGHNITLLRDLYPSSTDLQADILRSFLQQTIRTLHTSADYAEYVSYEKLLAFHFTFIQLIEPHKAYLKLRFGQINPLKLRGKDLAPLKDEFLAYAQPIITQGQQNGELAQRLLLGSKLNQLLWYQFLYIVRFWVNDFSTDTASTDAAIEKSTQWTFEILSHNLLDTTFDFGKFFVQNIQKPFSK